MTYSVSNLNATEELGAFLSTNSNILLHKSSKVNDNVFVFLDVSVGVPKNNYLIEKTSDNSFTLTNKLKYLNSSVQILCKTEGYEKTISVLLRGLY